MTLHPREAQAEDRDRDAAGPTPGRCPFGHG
jgi:hypothetical protein